MSAGKAAVFGILGFVVGGLLGAALGLGGGLLFTTIAGTSGFEGYSGFVVAYWLLGGLILGLIAGTIFGIRKGLAK